MNLTQRVRINTPLVASQVIDGEAVLINFADGSYYSADNVGACIITLIEQGSRLADICVCLQQQYVADLPQVESALLDFIAQLKREKLVVVEPETTGTAASNNPAGVSPSEAKSKFSVPQLHHYTDLQDLLLLDPIHDTDQHGWPKLDERKSA